MAALPAMAQKQVKIANGVIEGTYDESTHVYIFRGIPFAAPPVGDLRWKPPQPVKNWNGVRKADHFGPRAMQLPIFGDMNFRSDGMSEDCLYLNVWTPAKSGKKKLPVLVYFYGGGFVAGDGSEPRYDGKSMAEKGIVAVTVNYRPGIFGFFAHPRPPMQPEMGNAVPGLAGGVMTNSSSATHPQPQSRGAVHSAEIEYALGNLASNKVYAWTPEDYEISKMMEQYFANFIKTANPNGPGLPEWPKFASGERLVIDANPRTEMMDNLRARYKLLDQIPSSQ